MIPKLPALHFAAMALLGLTAPVLAQDKAGLNIDEAATGKPGGVAQYDMAQALFALGVANKDALLALMAARLAAGVQMTEVTRDGTQTPPANPADAAEGNATAPADSAAMLAAARTYAAGEETLLGLIEDTAVEEMQGLLLGASRQLNTLPAGAVDMWKIPFYGESYAEIGIKGDGDTPLLVTVADENGNRINCPARVDDRFYCDFVPRWNGYFTITVANTGTTRNSYALLTN